MEEKKNRAKKQKNEEKDHGTSDKSEENLTQATKTKVDAITGMEVKEDIKKKNAQCMRFKGL